MKAQFLCELRRKFEFCSGEELGEFFVSELGEASPSGRLNVDTEKALNFVCSCLDSMMHNGSPEIANHCRKTMEVIGKRMGKIMTFQTVRQACSLEGIKPGQYAISRGKGYEDAVTGDYLTAQDAPGRLDSTKARLARAGYKILDRTLYLESRGWRFIPGKGWIK